MIKINSIETIKKYRKTLLIFFVIVTALITTMILIFLLVKNETLAGSLNALILFGLLIFTILYKNVIQGYKNMSQLAKIVLNQSEPLKYKNDLFMNKTYLIENEYKLFKDTNHYSIYYKYINERSHKIFKIKKLKTLILLKDAKLDYYDENIHRDISNLEESFSKKERFYKHLILAIKKYENLKKEDLKQIGEVVFYEIGRQTFLQINVGLNTKDKKVYFLYSNKYMPNMDYKEIVEDIKKIIT